MTASPAALYYGAPAQLVPLYERTGICLSDEIKLCTTVGLAWAFGVWHAAVFADAGVEFSRQQIAAMRAFAESGDATRLSWMPNMADALTPTPASAAVRAALAKGPTAAVAVIDPVGLTLDPTDVLVAPRLPWEDDVRAAPGRISRQPIPARNVREWRLWPVPELADPDVVAGMVAQIVDPITVDSTPDGALPGVPSMRRLVDVYLAARDPELAQHGPAHAAKVAQHGLSVMTPDADPVAVLVFALLHDAARVSDGPDPDHAARGADLAERLQADGVLDFSRDRLDVLLDALRRHADFTVSDHPTIGACWDADRLDLHRVRLTHSRPLMSTARGERLVDATPPPATPWNNTVLSYVVEAQLR